MNTLAAPSLGGGLLSGGNVVRIVYVDEAGRGQVSEEPHFVVACAITNPDAQWHMLRRHYADMANDIFALSGNEMLNEYVFHAKDIWHGNKDFPRTQFRLEERMKIISRLADVPRLYRIPICVGIVDRKALHQQLASNSSHCRHLEHAYAYAVALQYVDSWMEKNCPGEVAMITAEDTDEVKKTVQMVHDGAKKIDTFDEFYDRGVFVTKSIVDSVNFAPKMNSPLLQLADHCAFLAKRASVGCPHARAIWKNVAPQVWKDNRHAGSTLKIRVPLKILDAIN